MSIQYIIYKYTYRYIDRDITYYINIYVYIQYIE